jgi:molybdopterin-guanine dinucleotide biosynthesis protein A
MVVANDGIFAVHGARLVPDAFPGSASLGGICTAIASARYDRVAVVGCDMPLLSPAELARLVAVDADAVVPRNREGFPEPLHAVYSKRCLGPIEARISAGQLKIAGFFPDVQTHFVDDVDPSSYRNVNTPEALAEAVDLLQSGVGPAP